MDEPSTLAKMIETMHHRAQGARPPLPLGKPTVVMDAGLASDDNLKLLKDRGFSYIVVSRSRPKDVPDAEFHQVKKGVEIKSFQRGDELFLHCWSEAKTKKEQSMLNKAKDKMEAELTSTRNGLSIKRRLKNYDKVRERIGKLRKQYSWVSEGFDIQVQQEGKNAVDMTWTFDEAKLGKPYDGIYFLCTDRTGIDPEQMWQIYIMLT